jgi:hypothetical protein
VQEFCFKLGEIYGWHVAYLAAISIAIPHEFILIIEADNSTRPCRVVWRKERRIDVTFDH